MTNSSCTSPNIGLYPDLINLLFQAILSNVCTLSPPIKWPTDTGARLDNYDFIVVGAGTAGSIVADRLTENTNFKALLVESGQEPPVESLIPGFTSSLWTSEYSYHFYGSGGACKATNTGKCLYPTGRMLGGTHGLNGLIHIRGTREDYDVWEKMGNEKWNYANALKYFRLSEKNNNPKLLEDTQNHSGNGKLNVDDYPPGYPFLTDVFAEAYEKNLGLEKNCDFNTGNLGGFGLCQGTMLKGERHTTARDYLSDRPNLDIIEGGVVKKVNFINKKAVSVDVDIDGTTRQIRARKEIILSAGSIHTPQILMLSGIGPRCQLDPLGIDVVQELPVAQNLEDHVGLLLFYEFHRSNPRSYKPTDPLVAMSEYIIAREGDFATNSLNFHAFTGKNPRSCNVDIQIMHIGFKQNDPALAQYLQIFGFNSDVSGVLKNIGSKAEVGIAIIALAQPLSSGDVTLGGPNISDDPIINFNHLSVRRDTDVLIDAFAEHIKLVEGDVFKKNEGKLIDLNLKACKQHCYLSRPWMECYIRQMSTSNGDGCGTCKMGKKTDPTAVVDSSLRVHGTKGLRVIDASVMPRIISSNINPCVAMIGERGADEVKQANGYPRLVNLNAATSLLHLSIL